MSIYEEWGLQPVINLTGSVTRLGGAPMPREVLKAFVSAAGDCVPLEALHGAANRYLKEVSGAEAGIVTAGAAASLLLGAAAILAKHDLGRMERLPQTLGFPNEFVVAREQRNGYDHAVRAAGAVLVEVGMNEVVAGAGVRRTEAWEYASAFGSYTAGVLYVVNGDSAPALADVVAEAHARNLPVLVDAAGELPPRANLQDILAAGADLVCFSGGKAIRGPQATGLLLGRKDLVASALLQMLDNDDHFELWEPPAELIDRKAFRGLPRHGIGRAVKVSKEQIIAQLTALKMFVSGTYDQELPARRSFLEAIVAALTKLPVAARIVPDKNPQAMPLLEIRISRSKLGRSALEVCRRLRQGSPAIYVGHGALADGILMVNPLHLTQERLQVVIPRLVQELTPA